MTAPVDVEKLRQIIYDAMPDNMLHVEAERLSVDIADDILFWLREKNQ